MTRHAWLALALLGGCGGSDGPSETLVVEGLTGDGQTGPAGATLAPYQVKVTNADGQPQSGVPVAWQVQTGCGSVSATVASTDGLGVATTTPTLGELIGPQTVRAKAASGSFTFTSSATAAAPPSFQVLAGCNNVPERYGSDLWVADGYGYSGTWGFRGRAGNAVKIWRLDAAGAPVLTDSIVTSTVGTISDIEVSTDGSWLIFTTEGGTGSGLYVYQLTSPGHPVFRAKQLVANGLHTGTLATIGGKLYAFTAKDPTSCALNIYDLSAAGAGTITTASSTPIPDNYCIHDTFVRDGIAFVFAWNTGLYILDVGNGARGGTPAQPVAFGPPKTFGGATHNGWWFWNPASGEKRYLFLGQELPGTIGVSSGGSIHVVDVSDLSAPVEVASYSLPGAGAHNFWMDEQAQVLYAAFYNGGVVALDVSGTLSGDLASRQIARVRPGGVGNTYVWGVMLYNGSLYASDMLSGLWQLAVP